MKILICELLEKVNKNNLLDAAVAYEIYPITDTSWLRLSLQGNVATKVMLKAEKVAVVACTIGSRLEELVTDYFNHGEPLRGVLLDGIANAAVDSLKEKACGLIKDEALLQGCQASGPINPGMPGLPIEVQRELLELVSALEIGITLTSSGVIFPRKSVSLIIGIGRNMKTWRTTEICAHCNLSDVCVYKYV
jgi:cobalamin-dependent methionine synthase I